MDYVDRILEEAARTITYMQSAGQRVEGYGDIIKHPALSKAYGELNAAIMEAVRATALVELERQAERDQAEGMAVWRAVVNAS